MPHHEPPPYLAYEELSTSQLEKIDRERAVVIMPLGPLEEHGPHLPFGVDAFNADYVAEETARLIHGIDESITIIKIPLLYLGTHVYRRGGSLWTRQRVVRDAVVDYGRSLVRHGFRRIVVVSAHGGPRHFVALEEAAVIVSRARGTKMISLTSRLIVDFLLGRYVEEIAAQMGGDFSEEDQKILSMDYHAGWWETSMMLWLKPHLVAQSYAKLPPALVPRARLRPGSPWTVGPGLGYLGAPAAASVKFAEATAVVLRTEIKRILEHFLAGTLPPSSVRSPLYFVPVFRTNFRRWLLLAGGAVLATVIAILAMHAR
jgi:creatinine amidohydrolase